MKHNGPPFTMYSRLGDIARNGWLDNRAGGLLITIRFGIVVALFGGNVQQKVARQYVHNAVRWPLYRDHALNIVALFGGNLHQDVAR